MFVSHYEIRDPVTNQHPKSFTDVFNIIHTSEERSFNIGTGYTCTHTQTHTNTHTHTLTHSHTHTLTHAHTHTLTHSRLNTQTLKHSNTHHARTKQ